MKEQLGIETSTFTIITIQNIDRDYIPVHFA